MDHESLYTTAAQVIPVFLLALLIEKRFLGGKDADETSPPNDRVGTAVIATMAAVAVLIYGEILSFEALLGHIDTANLRGFVTGAMLFGGGALVYIPVIELGASVDKRDRSFVYGFAAVLTVLGFIVCLGLVWSHIRWTTPF